MPWRIEVADGVETDLRLIMRHLMESYIAFGEDEAEACDRARPRVLRIQARFSDLLDTPYRGTLREEFGPGVRSLMMDRAILWFQVRPETETIRVLAVFFGGQDHIRQMYRRLLKRDET